jgi:hypothetical protein
MCPIGYEDSLKKLRGDHPHALHHPREQQPETSKPLDNPVCLTNSDGTNGDKSALATKLERVTEKAIDKTDQILDLPLPDPDTASFGAVLRAQTASATTVLNTQVRVDENRLRKQRIDRLPEILQIIKEEEEKLKELRREDWATSLGEAGDG